jgi:hypothetical protein
LSPTEVLARCIVCDREAPAEVRDRFTSIVIDDGVQRGRAYEAKEGDGLWLMRQTSNGLGFACTDSRHRQTLIKTV